MAMTSTLVGRVYPQIVLKDPKSGHLGVPIVLMLLAGLGSVLIKS